VKDGGTSEWQENTAAVEDGAGGKKNGDEMGCPESFGREGGLAVTWSGNG